MASDESSSVRAVLVDWGGVLTPPVNTIQDEWARIDRVDVTIVRSVIAGLHQRSMGGGGASTFLERFERGELTVEEFDVALANELHAAGVEVRAEGLVRRMMAGTQRRDEAMFALLHDLRAQGVALGLLSNSWGDLYDRTGWDVFDTTVISGEVGMRKPESRIFRYAAGQLGVPPGQCLLIDDLPLNITAAHGVGMEGIVHRSAEETRVALSAALGRAIP